jgi:hypothetical protein
MKAGKLITGLLAFFLVCALFTGQCLCAVDTTVYVQINETVTNPSGPVYDAHRCDPVGRVYPESGASVVIDVDNSYIDSIICTLDGNVIEDGSYTWGSWIQSEGATFTLLSVTESHTVSFTFDESYGES